MVLLLLRNRIDLYSEAQAAIFHFDLSPYFTNLEPVDKPNLEEQIKNFVAQNKIPPGNITVVIGEDALFVKAIPPDLKNEDEEIEKFIDSVPFDRVTQMSYVIEGGKLIVATNRDLYTSIKHAFENVGFAVSFIIPVFSTNLNIDPNTGLDENSAKIILKNTQTPAGSSFDNSSEKLPSTNKPPAKNPTQGPDKKRLLALVGVFGLLMVLLMFVTLNSLNSNQQPAGDIGNQSTTPTSIPIPTSVPVPEIPVGTSQATDSSQTVQNGISEPQ